VDQAIVDGNLITSPAWPSHPALLAKLLQVMGHKRVRLALTRRHASAKRIGAYRFENWKLRRAPLRRTSCVLSCGRRGEYPESRSFLTMPPAGLLASAFGGHGFAEHVLERAGHAWQIAPAWPEKPPPWVRMRTSTLLVISVNFSGARTALRSCLGEVAFERSPLITILPVRRTCGHVQPGFSPTVPR